MLATLATPTSVSKTSSATTTRRDGSISAAQHDSRVVLPDPGAPAKTMDRLARTQALRNRATWWLSMSRATSSSSERNVTPVKRRMLTMGWPPRLMSPWTMCSREPSSSWASCRPSAGSSLRWLDDASSSSFTKVRVRCSASWKTSSW